MKKKFLNMGYRYIGSKEKLAATIIDLILEACPNCNTIIDLMAGTGLFSLALRKKGFEIIASDVMTYSYHHLVANLLFKESPKFENLDIIAPYTSNRYVEVINILNDVTPIKGYFYRELSSEGKPANGAKPRCYFTGDNASKIDAIRQTIKRWKLENKISDVEHSLLLHDLIMATNDIANIAGTYGHYLSHFVARSLDPIKLSPTMFVNDNNTEHTVLQGYAEELASTLSADVCYIDPPYIKRQYAANYHVLETIAREDEPVANGKSGLRPWRDQYSNFCSKIKIFESFDKILSNIGSKHIFISYSEDGLISLSNLVQYFHKYGRVEVNTIEYKRFKSNNSKKDARITEYLIHIIKNI